MESIEEERKEKVKADLMIYYSLADQEAETVYHSAVELFHSLFTIVEFSSLLIIDEKIISALVILLIDNIDLTKTD
jgi:hypothetical protein